MKQNLVLSNHTVDDYLNGYDATQFRGATMYGHFQNRYQQLNRQLRMNTQDIMELYESDQTNSGPYALEAGGDNNQASFTFQQELRKTKDQKHSNEKVKVGCCITLSQARGQVVVYVSDQISKPGPENCQMVIPGQDGENMDMKAHFEPDLVGKHDQWYIYFVEKDKVQTLTSLNERDAKE